MADTSKFLETEAALAALLDELEKMKAASEQIDQAGVVVQQVTEASQGLTQWAGQILEQGSRQLESAKKITNDISAWTRQFDSSINEKIHQQQLDLRKLTGSVTRELGDFKASQQAELNKMAAAVATDLESFKARQTENFNILSKEVSKELEEAKTRQETAFQGMEKTIAGLEEQVNVIGKRLNILLFAAVLNIILAAALIVIANI